MDAIRSKSAYVYLQVRRALRAGRYAPGQRLDPARLAAEFNTSPTPVRFALYRLVGESLLVDHARNGLHVPLLTEVATRELYDWMENLLLLACDLHPTTPARKCEPLELSATGDLPNLTWQLFDAIARASAHRLLHQAVKQTNDRLAPIRQAEPGLIEQGIDELSELKRQLQACDMPALKSSLIEYHQRRKKLVPCIVALLNERNDGLR